MTCIGLNITKAIHSIITKNTGKCKYACVYQYDKGLKLGINK